MRFSAKTIGVLCIALVILLVCVVHTQANLQNDLKSEVDELLSDKIVFYIGSPVSYVDNQKMLIDEKDKGLYPVIKNNRTIIPVRFLAEKLGADVEWDNNTRTATLKLRDKTIEIVPGNSHIKVDNSKVDLDVAPQIKRGRIFVPLRAVVEAFNKEVSWHDGLIVVGDKQSINNKQTEKEILDEIVSRVNELPAVSSYENLKKLIGQTKSQNVYGLGVRTTDDMVMESTNQKAKVAQGADSAQSASNNYSKTNVQVQGVDEADVVKTDGEYIYKINGDKVIIAKAYPSSKLKVVNTLDFEEKRFHSKELYVDSKHLVVIGTAYKDMHTMDTSVSKKVKADSVAPPEIYYPRHTTRAIIYDITNKKDIEQLREIEIEGSHISSRKIDSVLYLIANKHINYHIVKENKGVTPCYRDSNVGKDFIDIDYSEIKYSPDCIKPNYLIIGGINLNSDEPMNVSTYLGVGNNIYASKQNLYVAATNYNNRGPSILPAAEFIRPKDSPDTLIYKFSLDNEVIDYKGKQEVPGTVLNQFSMDEHKGYFRIATTKGNTWRDDSTSQNNVYVLNKNLEIVGRLENIAPGERIYSARFMGDRVYLVTFKTVDPFFVIDLKNPSSPKVLGELKIPGFSDYLHPYDKNHIIGFGKETKQVPVKDRNGKIIDSRVVSGGMKLAIFDVTDVTNPEQEFVEKIGDMGTHSELLRNHKALLFSKEKQLLAFPITVRENKYRDDNRFEYGEVTFQGAYVYNININDGFKLKGKIEHDVDDGFNHQKKGYYYNRKIDRILYIDDVLYTLSRSMIKATNQNTLKEIKSIQLK